MIWFLVCQDWIFWNHDNESQHQINEIVLANGSDPADYNRDPLTLSTAKIDQDVLKLVLSFSGGCKDHEFKLIAFNYFMESNPVQADVLLSHDANGDLCEAYLTRELDFSLDALKQVYLRTYPDSDSREIIINLYPAGADSAVTLAFDF